MKLQRCQQGIVESPFNFRSFNGQYGDGIYAMKFADRPMQKYYTQNGENTFSFDIPDHLIINVTRKKFDYWTAKEFIFNNPQFKAFIFKHKGINIPTSKQILITDASIITNIQKR
jgi:hypothetical protein